MWCVLLTGKRKLHNLKVANYSETLLRTVAGKAASQISLRNCSKEQRQDPGYIGVFAKKKKTCRQTSKDYC